MENNFLNKVNFKLATFISLGIMLVIMLFTSKDFGITGDEMTQNTYGELVYKYFTTFGKDQSCFQPFGPSNRITNGYLYGGFYDFMCVALNKVLPFDPFNTRHFINAFFGFLVLLFVGKLAQFLKGWDAALLAVWFLFLSPRFFGESMNNPKDIPYALGMLMGVYFILKYLKSFPNPTKKDMIWLAVSIGYAINIRVGGLLLIPFLAVGVFIQFIFDWRKQYKITSKEIKSLLLQCTVISISGYFLGLLFWPYGLQNPLGNPVSALGEMAKFSTSIGMLFNDLQIKSDLVPWYYIPKWIFISSPIIILLGIIISPYLFFNKEYKFTQISFLFFAALFPLFYIIYKKSPLYDGWRHLLFIYPPLVVLASLTFLAIINKVKNSIIKYSITGIVILGLLLPAKWCIANHPNQIVYFNELVGGIDGAYSHFETDYYMNSLKQASYKLAQMENLFTTKDSVVIASNAIEPVIQYFNRINPRIQCIYIRYPQRYEKKWDYALIYTRFIEKDLLKNENDSVYFPPGNTISVIKADNTPLCAIVKKDPEQNAYYGNAMLKANNFDSAIVFFEKALQKDPHDETSLYNYAISLANKGRIPESIVILNKRLKMTPNDLNVYNILIKLYQAIGDRANAQKTASIAQAIAEKERELNGEE